MTFPFDVKEMENGSYRDASSFAARKTKIAVKIENSSNEPVLVETAGIDWDLIETTFPSDITDLFTYKKNSITIQTVLVTYENHTKKVITSIAKTRL